MSLCSILLYTGEARVLSSSTTNFGKLDDGREAESTAHPQEPYQFSSLLPLGYTVVQGSGMAAVSQLSIQDVPQAVFVEGALGPITGKL